MVDKNSSPQDFLKKKISLPELSIIFQFSDTFRTELQLCRIASKERRSLLILIMLWTATKREVESDKYL